MLPWFLHCVGKLFFCYLFWVFLFVGWFFVLFCFSGNLGTFAIIFTEQKMRFPGSSQTILLVYEFRGRQIMTHGSNLYCLFRELNFHENTMKPFIYVRSVGATPETAWSAMSETFFSVSLQKKVADLWHI